jgi:hypothetical protein
MRICCFCFLLFSLVVPIGAAVVWFGVAEGGAEILPFALAFSAGTFICIASSDLLPELQFHRHDRVGLSAALLVGLALAGTIARLESSVAQAHDHSHGAHDHSHDHDHSHGAHDHAHGILDESGPLGRTVAILILSVPLVLAAAMTPDRYSGAAVVNKGLYNQNYASTANADQFTLRKESKPVAKIADAPPAPVAVALPPANVARVPGSAAPATASVATSNMGPGGPSPEKVADMVARDASKPAGKADAKSYGSFTLDDLKAQVPMSKDGNFILEVPELYYTAGDKEVQGVLTGQSVETTAQVMPEKVNNEDGKRLRILRMLVQCCAADARPYSVPVEFAEKAPTFKDMAWVKVTGIMGYKQEGGQLVPVIQAKEIKETTAPDNAMLY